MGHEFLPNAYFQGKVVPFKEATVSIATHALQYGTAAFSGMRVEPSPDGKNEVVLFRPELHFKRLSDSAKLIGYKLSPSQVEAAITKFIASNPANSYYMRSLVYVSDTIVTPRLHDVEHDLLIYGFALGDFIAQDGISCTFSSWTRGEDRSLPLRGKISGAYIMSALAKTEAAARGFDEAILLNTAGKVAEASAMNIFMVKDGVLTTPSVTQDILEGITRRSLLEVAAKLGIPTSEREIDKSELLLAEEVFLTGTAAVVAPVTRIETYSLPIARPITTELTKRLKKIIARQDKAYDQWTKPFSSRQ
jgi:branched-chain amino acid aminotransferase